MKTWRSTQNCLYMFKPDLSCKEEYQAAKAEFGDDFSELLTGIPAGSRVLARYGTFPHFHNFVSELENKGCSLFQAREDMEYVHEARWIEDLAGITPKTWWVGKDN